MLWLYVVVCLSTLWQTSFIQASKPEPVDLAYSCMKVRNNRGYHNDVPIILIHGMSMFKERWKGINEVLALETGREVCIVDMRNHGESPWSDVIDTAAMAEDVKHLMDKLNIPKAVLLGHSLGGKISVHFALTYPERVEKLISEDMRPNGLSPEFKKESLLYLNLLKDVNDLVPQGVSEKEAKEIFLKNFNKEKGITMFNDDPDMIPIKCTNGKCRWNTNTLLYAKMFEDIYLLMPDSSGRFDGPALFIYGTESNFKVGDDESNIKKLFPNAKLVGVKGSGHLVHVSHGPEFMSEVIKFINEKLNSIKVEL